MGDILIDKLTSRKFWLGAGSLIALFLASAGVIDQDSSTQLAEAAGVALYIIVEGLVDFIRERAS